MLSSVLSRNILLYTFFFLSLIFSGCGTGAAKTEPSANAAAENRPTSETGPKTATIDIKPNSPADTVRVFYKNLREKKFREALFLTNLRPAIESLTETELKEFSIDFEAIAKNVPADVQINGEIVSGDSATVTAKLPDENLEKEEIQEVRLRKENGVWIILTVDAEAEKLIKLEGKNYLYALRIETHQDEAKAMLDRIAKAQMAFAAQNQGKFGAIPALIESGFLPADVQSSASTGYIYAVTLTGDGADYFSTATPAEYGKSGKMSYLVVLKNKNSPSLTSKDNKGEPLKK